MQHRKRQITLKQRMGLCLAAFFAAFAMQLTLNGYQSRAVQAVQDAQMGSFNAISRFQGGVESSISVLENYRWENSEPEEIIDRLQSASSTCNAWLWRIGTSLNSLESVSDEQRVLYSAVDTVYQTYTGLLDELENDLLSGNDAAASQLYYAKVVPCGDYLSQYTLQLLETAIQDSQTTYTTISALNERITMLQTVVVALCVALGCVTGLMVMRLLTPVQQMIAASRAIGKSEFDTPDIPLPKQPEIAQLAESFNIMKHSMAQQVTTLQEKNEIERELHRQKTEALELQNRMERSRLQQLRSQIDPHFLFNTLNVIQQTAGTETAYRTQALIMALSHLLRYSLMSNDEQVPLSREVRIVDEYYSIYHVRFGERVRMEWRISDSLDLTETMVPSFILQPIVENAFKHGICPKEEGGVVRIRVNPLREKGLLCIRVVDNGVGIQLDQLRQLRGALSQPGERWEHIGIYNVAARLRLLDGSMYQGEGQVDFIDSRVQPETGVVQARASFANSDGRIMPGQYVRIFMDGDVLVNAVLIPQKAVLITQKGSFVMTLDKDNVVGTRKVEVSETIGDMYLVDSGLKGGERIICEGMVKARPGAKVSVMGDGQAQKGQAAQKTAQK